MRYLALMMAVALAGCALEAVRDRMAGYRGQPVSALIDKLGIPTEERVIAGRKVYIWSTSRNMVLPITNTSTTSGYVGTTPYYGTTTTPSYMPINANCSIQLTTDSRGVITRYQWEGNQPGCRLYARGFSH